MPPAVGAANVENAAEATADATEVIRALDIDRSFGETRALQGCSLRVRAGEIHAVVGENGSGKSTLVKILSGVIFPDSGSLEINGSAYRRLRTPRVARNLGIATVFQEVLVVDPISVLDNVWLGADGEFRTRIGLRQKRSQAAEVLGMLLEHPPDLDTPVELLDLATRQVCVLARALVQHPRVLILDEATSALDVSTCDRLFEVLRRLALEGTATVFISHRMDEIVALADRATVLRGGATVGTLEHAQLEPSRVLELMSGEGEVLARRRSGAHELGETFLQTVGVVLRPGGSALDAEFRSGEIVGLAGLEGHGQQEFIRALAGIEPPHSGRVLRCRQGRSIPIVSQRQAARLGVAYVPRDRKLQGVFEPLSILDNFSLPTIRRDRGVTGLVSDRRRRTRLDEFVRRLKIRLASPRYPVTSLSGGNQQKVVIARWLAMKPQVLVLDDPTRGVDVGAKTDLYQLLGDLASEGVAIVMLSTEIEEHIALMDRVLVFREGELFVDIPREQLSRERLIAGFFGQHHGDGGSVA